MTACACSNQSDYRILLGSVLQVLKGMLYEFFRVSFPDSSNYNTVTGNIVLNNSWDGVSQSNCTKNTIVYNTIFNNTMDGI
jgi:parallel beta-helix repeat protein